LAERARGAVVLVVFAVAIVVSTAITGLAVEGPGPAAVHRIGILLGSLALNAAVFLVVFWVLNVRPLRVRELAPGVALAAVGSLALQSAGAWYVDHAVARASDTYGAFAIVIGLLSWLWLGSNLLLLAAEVDVVLHRRLWPRALTGDLEPADRRALREAAEAARQDPRQEILVRFSDEPRSGGGAGAVLQGVRRPAQHPVPERAGERHQDDDEQPPGRAARIEVPADDVHDRDEPHDRQ
jgi:hypothetical protein